MWCWCNHVDGLPAQDTQNNKGNKKCALWNWLVYHKCSTFTKKLQSHKRWDISNKDILNWAYKRLNGDFGWQSIYLYYQICKANCRVYNIFTQLYIMVTCLISWFASVLWYSYTVVYNGNLPHIMICFRILIETFKSR